MHHRFAGAAGGEDEGRELRRRKLRHRGRPGLGAVQQERRVLHARQALRAAADRVGLGIGGGELLQPVRCPVAGEEAHLPAHECRGEGDEEVVAVAAQVQGVVAVGQARCRERHVAQESCCRDRLARRLPEQDLAWLRGS